MRGGICEAARCSVLTPAPCGSQVAHSASIRTPRSPPHPQVRVVQYTIPAGPLAGPSAALLQGVPVRSASTTSCSCALDASQLGAAVNSTGFARSVGPAGTCGYAFIDRPGVPVQAGSITELTWFMPTWENQRRTSFTPFRFNFTYVVPLVRDEGSQPVTNMGNIRGATIAPGLGGVWLPIHQSLGFPDIAARRAAEAEGKPFIILVRSVAVVPSRQADGSIVAERIRSQQSLAVRLLSPGPAPSATRTRAASRSRTPKKK